MSRQSSQVLLSSFQKIRIRKIGGGEVAWLQRRQFSLAQLPYNTIQGPNHHGGLRGQGLEHEH